MKLPEFSATRKMNTNMTSTKAVADRSGEFKANANVAGVVNTFSEDLERKRRIANVNTFNTNENLKTEQDWVEAKRQLSIARDPKTGNVDFARLSKLDVEGRFGWEDIRDNTPGMSTEAGDNTYAFDKVVGSWWNKRLTKGTGAANNADQAAAYLGEARKSMLNNTIQAQVYYNDAQAKYHDSVAKENDDQRQKIAFSSNLDVVSAKNLKEQFRKVIDGYRKLKDTRSPEQIQAFEKAATNAWANGALNHTMTIIQGEKKRNADATGKEKEASNKRIQGYVRHAFDFMNGITDLSHLASKEGKEGKGGKGKKVGLMPEGLEGKMPSEFKKTKTESILDELDADAELKSTGMKSRKEAAITEGYLSVDAREIYNDIDGPDGDLDGRDPEADKKLAAEGLMAPSTTPQIGDTMSGVGKNMFGLALSPAEQQMFMKKFTQVGIEAGVKDIGLGIKNIAALSSLVASGATDPTKKDSIAYNSMKEVLGRITGGSKAVLSGNEVKYIKDASNAYIIGSVVHRMPDMSVSDFKKQLQTLPDIVKARREEILEMNPDLAKFEVEGMELVDQGKLANHLLNEYSKKMNAIRTNAAEYYSTKSPEMSAKWQQTKENLSAKSLSNYRAAVLKRARKDGIVSGIRKNGTITRVRTIPNEIVSNIQNKFQSLQITAEDPRSEQLTHTIMGVKDLLGSGRDWYTGMNEIMEASGGASNILPKSLSGGSYGDVLHLMAMTEEPTVLQRALTVYRTPESKVKEQITTLKETETLIDKTIDDATEELQLAVTGNDPNNVFAKEQLMAMRKFIKLDMLDTAAFGSEKSNWLNILTSRFRKVKLDDDEIESKTMQIQSSMFGTVIEEEGNRLLVPKTLIKSNPQAVKRVGIFLDNMAGKSAIRKFIGKANVQAPIFTKNKPNALFLKYAATYKRSANAKAVLSLKGDARRKFIGYCNERYRDEVAKTAVWRQDNDGAMLVYQPTAVGADVGITNYRGVYDQKRGNKPVLVPWDAMLGKKKIKGYDSLKYLD